MIIMKKKIKNKRYYTLKELDKELKWTKKEWEEIKRRSDERIIRYQLQDARREAEMTQEELSKKSGIPRPTISNIENGRRNPTVQTLYSLASAMGKTLEIRFK
jgi:DNA-binding XRE family transcriptional regulator